MISCNIQVYFSFIDVVVAGRPGKRASIAMRTNLSFSRFSSFSFSFLFYSMGHQMALTFLCPSLWHFGIQQFTSPPKSSTEPILTLVTSSSFVSYFYLAISNKNVDILDTCIKMQVIECHGMTDFLKYLVILLPAVLNQILSVED